MFWPGGSCPQQRSLVLSNLFLKEAPWLLSGWVMKWLNKWSYHIRLGSTGVFISATALKFSCPTLSAPIQWQYNQTKQAITSNPGLDTKSGVGCHQINLQSTPFSFTPPFFKLLLFTFKLSKLSQPRHSSFLTSFSRALSLLVSFPFLSHSLQVPEWERGAVRFDLALLWGFEVCVDERKWSAAFRQAPNEGIKKLRWPFPILNFPGTTQDRRARSILKCAHRQVLEKG